MSPKDTSTPVHSQKTEKNSKSSSVTSSSSDDVGQKPSTQKNSSSPPPKSKRNTEEAAPISLKPSVTTKPESRSPPQNDPNPTHSNPLPPSSSSPLPQTTTLQSPLSKWSMGVAILAIILSITALIWQYRLSQQYGNKPEWQLQWQKDRQTLESSLRSHSSQWETSSKSLTDQIQSLQEKIIQEQKKQQATVSSVVDPKIGTLRDDIENTFSALEKELLELQEHQEFLERRQVNMQTLIAELPSQRVLWQLIEIVQLQRQALRYLQVDKNLPTALANLQMALDILRTLDLGDNEHYLQHTKEVMVTLRAQNTPSVSELDYQISSLSNELAALSPRLHSENALLADIDATRYQAIDKALPSTSPIQPELPWYRQLWADAMFELNNAFRFYPEDRPLVPPEGAFFLRENIKLSLLIIRSAALRHDEQLFDTELLRLDEWVKRFFEDDEALQAVKTRIAALQKHTLEVDASKMEQLVRQGENQLAILEERLRIGENP